jgi:hypothetical protein
MTYDIANVTLEVYRLLSLMINGLSANATALVGLLILAVIVYLSRDIISSVFGLFGSIGKIGKK